jgi:hypothetical protein
MRVLSRTRPKLPFRKFGLLTPRLLNSSGKLRRVFMANLVKVWRAVNHTIGTNQFGIYPPVSPDLVFDDPRAGGSQPKLGFQRAAPDALGSFAIDFDRCGRLPFRGVTVHGKCVFPYYGVAQHSRQDHARHQCFLEGRKGKRRLVARTGGKPEFDEYPPPDACRIDLQPGADSTK